MIYVSYNRSRLLIHLSIYRSSSLSLHLASGLTKAASSQYRSAAGLALRVELCCRALRKIERASH